MPFNPQNIDSIIREALQNPTDAAPSFLSQDAREKIQKVQGYDDYITLLRDTPGIDEAMAHHLASTTIFATIEKSGLNPFNWFPSLPIGEQTKVRYGVTEYNQAIKFFNDWSTIQKAFFIIGVLGAIATIILGIGPALEALALARVALLAGQGLQVAANAYNLGKLFALPRLLIPGLVSAVAWVGGLFASLQLSGTGDLLTYIRQNLAKSEENIDKLKLEAEKASAGTLGKSLFPPRSPVTRITMAKTSKPTLFLGTLFSSRVKSVDAYERGTADQIDNKEELQSDAQTELNRWLKTLPGRLIYTIAVSINPFDENGVKQTGTWATLGLGIRNLGGKFTPLDTILLGPVDPLVYYPKTQEVMTVQQELPKLLTAEEIAEVQLPTGDFKLVDKAGNIVPSPIGAPALAPVAAQVPTPVFIPPTPPPPAAFRPLPQGVAGPVIPTPATPPAAAAVAAPVQPYGVPIPPSPVPGLVSQEDYFERGIAAPPGTPSRAYVEGQRAAAGPAPTLKLWAAGAAAAAKKTLNPAYIGPIEILHGQPCTNFRGAPDLQSPIFSCLPNGTRGDVVAYRGFNDGYEWYTIVVNGVTGHVVGSHLRIP